MPWPRSERYGDGARDRRPVGQLHRAAAVRHAAGDAPDEDDEDRGGKADGRRHGGHYGVRLIAHALNSSCASDRRACGSASLVTVLPLTRSAGRAVLTGENLTQNQAFEAVKTAREEERTREPAVRGDEVRSARVLCEGSKVPA